MVVDAVGFAEIGLAVEVNRLAAGDRGRRLAVIGLGVEVQVLPVHDFDGALVAANLLAIAVMVVAEEATVVDVEVVGVFVNGAERVGDVAVVVPPWEALEWPMGATPLKNWTKTQHPNMSQAGTSTVVKKKTMVTSDTMREWGNLTM